MTTALEARVRALINDRIFKAFWEAAEHFGDRDLVVFFDESDVEPLSVLPRKSMLDAPALPRVFRNKIQRHAGEAAVHLRGAETAFWLMVMFADGEGTCLAVNAKPLAPGGTA